MNRYVSLGLALCTLTSAACLPRYVYRFEPSGAGVERASETANVDYDAVDVVVAMREDALDLTVTNRTDEVVQVEWSKVVLLRSDGTSSPLLPETDLGWVAPQKTLRTRLFPFVVPHRGAAAAAYEGRELGLRLPVVVLHEPLVYWFHFIAHVQPGT